MSSEPERPTELERPNGNAMIIFGWTALAIGVVLIISGLALPATVQEYSFSDPRPNTVKWPAFYLGCGLFGIALPVLLTGKLIRAIFFLEGRSVVDGDRHPPTE